MIITISGKPGSGKSKIAKELANKLKFDHYSVGDLQGKLAIERGLTIIEMMTLEKNQPEIHKQVDKKTKQLGKTKDNFVIDGWLAYHFIPHSFKIFLNVDEIVGADRIFKEGGRFDEPQRESLGSTIIHLKHRLKESQKGFEKAHKINFLDPNNYDYILDTTNLTPKQVIKNLLNQIKKNKK